MLSHYFRVGNSNEQDAVKRIANFLAQVVGWTVFDVITDTGSDLDVVLSSPGESEIDNPNPNTIFIRIRGTANHIQLYTYETYESISVNTGENTDNTYGLVITVGTFTFICVADLERFVFAVEEDGGNRYLGYVGRIDAYTEWSQHRYPLLIKGMQNVAYDFFYTAASRNMFMVRSDGTGGSAYFPVRVENDLTLDASNISARNGKITGFKVPVMYNLDSNFSEVAGELRGLYTVPVEKAAHGNFVDLEGETYVVILGDGTYAWAVGPVARGGTIPPRHVPLSFDMNLSPPA